MSPTRSTSLSGALVTILVSCALGAILMAAAAAFMGEALYYIPAAIFVVAGVLGYVFVSKLDAKINGSKR
jgi:hypothetical protein